MDWVWLAQAVKRLLCPALRKLPGPVYTDLFLKGKEPHGTLERLRCVFQKAEIEGQKVTRIRIVDPLDLGQRRITVREYADLDGHAEVIWYEGWFGYVPGPKVELTPVNPSGRRS
ncbi:MAG: hypothetical protein HYT78_12530 [Deltaproteobacteria bacterium]|nr:hypothetical protein [Deltaproteobacteria bacterium]